MPLFACSKCNVVENTALGCYWWEHLKGKAVLCSECGKGKWHGLFPKEDAGSWVPDERGRKAAPGHLFIKKPAT